MTLNISANRQLTHVHDRMGHFLIDLKNTLVATGLWVVTGSGDGLSAVQNQGQTAGIGGSYDVFTASPAYVDTSATWTTGGANSISNPYAWFQIKEVGGARVFQFQRHNSTSDNISLRFCPSGVATTGATSSVAPAPAPSNNFVNLIGNVATRGATTMAAGQLLHSVATTTVYHFWHATTARAGGVCPFAFMTFSKLTNTFGAGFFYESLVDAVASNTEPWLLSNAGSFGAAFGTVGTASSNGPFWSTLGQITAGLVPWSFDYSGSAVAGINYPGSSYPPMPADNVWRTQYCRARTATAYLGRSEHFLQNYLARDYPTTYNLASAEPKIAVGQLLLPWSTNVVPDWGP
jgi:hypothetical protein